MNTIKRISIFVILLFLFFVVASAQQIPPSYGFLEVVDYKNKPVADASVRRLYRFNLDESSIGQANFLEKTNQKGLLEKGIRVDAGYYNTLFSIDKSGYHSFIDCFEMFKFLGYGWRNNKENPIKIELLKIPQTPAERKAIGKEQLKRELFLAIFKGDMALLSKSIKPMIYVEFQLRRTFLRLFTPPIWQMLKPYDFYFPRV
jgi:hypothetical protein